MERQTLLEHLNSYDKLTEAKYCLMFSDNKVIALPNAVDPEEILGLEFEETDGEDWSLSEERKPNRTLREIEPVDDKFFADYEYRVDDYLTDVMQKIKTIHRTLDDCFKSIEYSKDDNSLADKVKLINLRAACAFFEEMAFMLATPQSSTIYKRKKNGRRPSIEQWYQVATTAMQGYVVKPIYYNSEDKSEINSSYDDSDWLRSHWDEKASCGENLVKPMAGSGYWTEFFRYVGNLDNLTIGYECENLFQCAYAIIDYVIFKEYEIRVCKNCNKYFLLEGSHRIYCSDQCYKTLRRENTNLLRKDKCYSEGERCAVLLAKRCHDALPDRQSHLNSEYRQYLDFKENIFEKVKSKIITAKEGYNIFCYMHEELIKNKTKTIADIISEINIEMK